MGMKLSDQDLHYYNSNRPEPISKMACWSPVKNMFIGMRGKVMTCCYNKSYLLGEYPTKNLHDIWFGDKRKQLIETLKNNDFSNGCQSCFEVIRAKNINGLTAKKFDYLPLNDTYPTRIDFELSNECNLECKMCRGEYSSSIRRNVEKLPPIVNPYSSALLDELREFIPHLTNCHFLGGEPFLIPIYLEIWNLISELNPSIRISIVTNSTILSDRVKLILEKLNFDITVSIDSVNSENYASIRKNGNLEKVKANIKYLREYTNRKNTRFNLSACAMIPNSNEFVDLINYANSLECELFFTRVTYPRELSLEIQKKDILKAIVENIRQSSILKDTEIQKNNFKTLNDLANHIEFWVNECDDPLKVKNITGYFDALTHFLQQKEPNEHERLFENIKTKILYLLEVARRNDMANMAEEKLCEVPLKTIYEMVPTIEKEHLLHLFKAYIVPIEK